VGEAEFEAALPELAEAAFMDASLRTNPRMPMVGELVGLLRAGFSGRRPPPVGGRRGCRCGSIGHAEHELWWSAWWS
jgi:hypothetical protein